MSKYKSIEELLKEYNDIKGGQQMYTPMDGSGMDQAPNEQQMFTPMDQGIPEQSTSFQDIRKKLDEVKPEEERESAISDDDLAGALKQSKDYFQAVGEGRAKMPGIGLGIDTDQMDIQDAAEGKALTQEIKPEGEDLTITPEEDKNKPSTIQDLYKQYLDFKNKEAEAIAEAAEKDRRSQLMQGVFGNLGKALTYSATAGGKFMASPIPIDIKPIDMKYLEQARLEQRAKDEGLLKELGLKELELKQRSDRSKYQPYTYLSTPEGIVKVDKETGEAELAFTSELAKDRYNLNKDAEDRRKEAVRYGLYEKPIKTFNSDEIVKKANMMENSALIVRDLVNSDNPIGHKAVTTFMARASGEVGALSEEDKKPFGGGQSIKDRLKQMKEDYLSGKLTPENKKYLLDLLDTMETHSLKTKAKRAQEISRQYKFSPIKSEELKSLMLGEDNRSDEVFEELKSSDSDSKKSEAKEVKTPSDAEREKALTWAKNNPDNPDAKKILEQFGK